MTVPTVLPSQRHLFDIPEDVAFLNCAYMSPLAHRVVAAGERGLRAKGRPWEISTADFFSDVETVRSRIAALIGADADGIAIAPAASYGLSTAAQILPVSRGQRIVLLDEQFPSNVYPWRARAEDVGAEIVVVPRPADGDWTDAILSHLDNRVAIAAMANCHWTDGGLIDVETIGQRCRALGIKFVLDLTQSAGALPFDCARVQPDVIACASYKWLLGPYSLGFTYVAPEWRDKAPLEHNWIGRAGSEDFARLVAYEEAYQPGARRFDVGERANFALIPAFAESLTMLLEWTVPAIASTLRARTESLADAVAALGYSSLPSSQRAGHFLAIGLPPGGSATPAALATSLAAKKVYVSVRGESVRITPHLYNTDSDVSQLVEALRSE